MKRILSHLPQRRVARLALVLILLLAGTISAQIIRAQGDDDVDDLLQSYTFRPIDDIIDQDLLITNFASDGTASLPLETSIPVACTLVYGTTPAFGQLTLDQDMAGGTHASHNPLLTGLDPETTYYFRVQGIDDAGMIYISEVMTFTTPAFENEPVTNLLAPELGAEITGYSSAFGNADPDETWGVLNAVDGSPNTAWSSAGDGNDAWIAFKLAQRSRVTQVGLQSRSMSDGSSIVYSFTVTADDDEVYGPFEVSDTASLALFEVDFEAETLRFDFEDTSGGNTGAVEIVAYGEPVE